SRRRTDHRGVKALRNEEPRHGASRLGKEGSMAFATRLTPAMAARWRGAGLWSDETFASALARRVRTPPEREALTDGTRRLTYRELADGIDRMAARLRALGIAAGDVVTIQL